jgi:hypothetical protein
MTRLPPEVLCPSKPLAGKTALAPATASVLRNVLRDAPESSGAFVLSLKSLEVSSFLQTRFRMAAPLFQYLSRICGARYHSATYPQSKMCAHCMHCEDWNYDALDCSLVGAYSSPSAISPLCPLWLFSVSSVLNSEKPNTAPEKNVCAVQPIRRRIPIDSQLIRLVASATVENADLILDFRLRVNTPKAL